MPNTAATGITADAVADQPVDDLLEQWAPQPVRERARWRSRLSRFDMVVTPYLLIAPFFLLFAVFGLFPLLYNAVVSFRTWRLDDPTLVEGASVVAALGSDADRGLQQAEVAERLERVGPNLLRAAPPVPSARRRPIGSDG